MLSVYCTQKDSEAESDLAEWLGKESRGAQPVISNLKPVISDLFGQETLRR